MRTCASHQGAFSWERPCQLTASLQAYQLLLLLVSAQFPPSKGHSCSISRANPGPMVPATREVGSPGVCFPNSLTQLTLHLKQDPGKGYAGSAWGWTAPWSCTPVLPTAEEHGQEQLSKLLFCFNSSHAHTAPPLSAGHRGQAQQLFFLKGESQSGVPTPPHWMPWPEQPGLEIRKEGASLCR